MKKTRILVAEDDPHIREGLVDTLESEGYAVTAVRDGGAALREWTQAEFDLLLLDVMMPERSGYDVCRAVRAEDRRIPVILLTAKGEEIDKVVGLELGADDYVTKPFGVRELLARIAAVLRRARSTAEVATPAAETPAPAPDVFSFGAATIERRKLRGRLGRREFEVTVREVKLMDVFLARPDEVLTRDDLLNAGWGVGYFGTTRTLDQHIAQLRKKIERSPAEPEAILTVHGVGYRYRPVGGKA